MVMKKANLMGNCLSRKRFVHSSQMISLLSMRDFPCTDSPPNVEWTVLPSLRISEAIQVRATDLSGNARPRSVLNNALYVKVFTLPPVPSRKKHLYVWSGLSTVCMTLSNAHVVGSSDSIFAPSQGALLLLLLL